MVVGGRGEEGEGWRERERASQESGDGGYRVLLMIKEFHRIGEFQIIGVDSDLLFWIPICLIFYFEFDIIPSLVHLLFRYGPLALIIFCLLEVPLLSILEKRSPSS